MKKLISLFLFLPLFALAASIYDNPLRPTIPEVIQYTKDEKKSGKDDVTTSGRFDPSRFLKAIDADGPAFIAKLEAAHPDARFVFMGRDTQVLADMTEAFYLSIGQKDRVVRLGVSRRSLDGLSDKDVMLYLKHFGLDLNTIEKDRPFVLVDTVSGGGHQDGVLVSGRQGRAILQVIFNEWIASGRKAEALLGKVDMVGLLVSTFQASDAANKKRYLDLEKGKERKEKNKKILAGKKDVVGRDFVVASIPDTKNVFNEAGYDHHTGAWHDRFMTPKKEGAKLVPNPGTAMPKDQKKAVLWMQLKILELIEKKQFTQRTIKAGTERGISFGNMGALSCRNAYN